jgi:thiol-disulfide isomerase/thioredoxin
LHTETQKFTLKDEPEKILDYHLARPEKGPIAGRVTFKGKGVAGASVELVAATSRGGLPFTVKTDPEGRFQTQRQLDRNVIHARNAEGTLGAIVEIGAEDPEVEIQLAPTATASGILLDENGKPAANMPLDWGRRVFLDNSRTMSMTLFAPKVATDAEGHFTLPSLVVGQAYDIALERDGHYLAAGRLQPESAEPIDLGTLKAGAYRAPELINPEEMSSFDKDAPDAGHVAPPIEATTLDGKRLTLDDFKGKYVLLDFWATWCGPCIKEIPQLQSVYDAFGKDERFVILSLSVDEKIDQPKEFQETRKLPWMQAFVGEGVHGPIPQMFGIRAIPALVLLGPDGKIVARGMRGEEIKESVSRALATP